MELRHLRYFVAVAEELNFRKAAQRLNISRPALSKQIKDLENEVGVRLLERDTVSVALTQAGEGFLDDATSLLKMAGQAIERAGETNAGRRGKLRIGSVGIIATDFLPRTLKIFRENFPDVEVVFVEMLPIEQLAALADGRIDIGFAYGPGVDNLPEIDSLRVIHSTFGVAVSRHHPFAAKPHLALGELHGETLLCLGGDGPSSHRENICRIFTAAGIKPGKARFIDGFDSLVNLLAAVEGISILPVVLDLSKQDIAIVPILAPGTDLGFHMWAVWRAGITVPHVKHFVHLLRERLRETNAPLPLPDRLVS
ncbi:MAG: LysR substrate-binding domain-containing protein [Verrucomicrobiota bacterium]